MFSFAFGIHPWDLHRLTVVQFNQYVRWYEKQKAGGLWQRVPTP